VFMLGGEVGGLVPPLVEERLRVKQASLRDRRLHPTAQSPRGGAPEPTEIRKA
jgi:hypothetical protein